jgi:hypothetical protein
MHDTDVTSLVFGLVFVGLSAVWGLLELGVLTVSVLPLAIPLVLVAVGVVGVVVAVARNRREARDEAF